MTTVLEAFGKNAFAARFIAQILYLALPLFPNIRDLLSEEIARFVKPDQSRSRRTLRKLRKDMLYSSAFYRPSAFFLEPSHFAVYCIPVIVTTLFSRTGDEKRERQIALFISTGVLLSTSGMGIGVVIICWAFYLLFIFGRKGENRKLSFRKLLNKRSLTFFLLVLLPPIIACIL